MLQHEPDVGPGNLADWLDAQRISWRLVEVRSGEFPATTGVRAVVVLGSEGSAYDATLGWLRAEKEFLRPLIDAGVPVLGLCFGAQLLALLTGGSVRRADRTVRGWTEVAADDELLGGRWLSWHGDEIIPPPAAEVTAHSATCVEAFAVGPHLGLQFHPEVTDSIIEGWTREDFGERGPEAEGVRADTAEHLAGARDGAGRIYERFFAPALARG